MTGRHAAKTLAKRNDTDLTKIAKRFDFPGRLVTIKPIGAGNVNDTYMAVFRTHFSEEKGIIQRINQHVFKKPAYIIENMRVVTEHVHRRLEEEADGADRIWQLPRLIPVRDNGDFYLDDQGDYWRAMTVIASAVAYDKPQGPEHALEAGAVLGQFHRLLSDLEPQKLRDTLPGFHVTPLYLKAYEDTLEDQAAQERLNASTEAKRLKQFIDNRRDFIPTLESALKAQELQVRLIHGDPKVNNIMIDELSGKGTSIVDLDTVKPGLIHYDFGDALRSICNPVGEEVQDLAGVHFDLDLCEAFVQGYMSFAKDFLTPSDHRYLFDSIRLIALELGLRFFEDYLAGSVYFKVRHTEHNLHRARVQLKLCESIETRHAKIKNILEKF